MSGVRESLATHTPKKKCEPPQLPPDREDKCPHSAGGQQVLGVKMGSVALLQDDRVVASIGAFPFWAEGW